MCGLPIHLQVTDTAYVVLIASSKPDSTQYLLLNYYCSKCQYKYIRKMVACKKSNKKTTTMKKK